MLCTLSSAANRSTVPGYSKKRLYMVGINELVAPASRWHACCFATEDNPTRGNIMMKKTLLLFAGTLLATAAFGEGWDWDVSEVIASGEWRQETLDWAQDIHPNPPTQTWLLANQNPPPREMWCPMPETWEENCDGWSPHMEFWLRNYLQIPYTDPLPASLADYPEECASSCDDIW